MLGLECAGYCYHGSKRIRSQRRITRTSQDGRIGASEDLCCTEKHAGQKQKATSLSRSKPAATYLSSGISEYQSGDEGTMGKVEGREEI